MVLAADGREGLAEVARSQPDVVLCDLTMPVMDGLELRGACVQIGSTAKSGPLACAPPGASVSTVSWGNP